MLLLLIVYCASLLVRVGEKNTILTPRYLNRQFFFPLVSVGYLEQRRNMFGFIISHGDSNCRECIDSLVFLFITPSPFNRTFKFLRTATSNTNSSLVFLFCSGSKLVEYFPSVSAAVILSFISTSDIIGRIACDLNQLTSLRASSTAAGSCV